MPGDEDTAPIVSVIVPAHNAARTIDRTLDSLRAQDFARWEAIVIDDGSSDGTPAIVERHVAGDARVQLVQQAQGGASAARNAGLARARGEWIQFLDADDTLTPGHLTAMLRAADAVPQAGLLHCGWQRVVAGEPWLEANPAERIEDAVRATARSCPFAIHAALTRRDRIAAVGGFDVALKVAEDWDLWQRLARIGVRFESVPAVSVDVHVEPDSLSTDSAQHLADGLTVIARGHGRDARLPAEAGFAQGAAADEYPVAVWHFVAWIAGAALGRGADPAALLRAVDLPKCANVEASVLASNFLHGLAVGAGPAASPPYAVWSHYAPRVAALCDHVGAVVGVDDLARAMSNMIEDRVASAVPSGVEAQVGRHATVAIDILDTIRDRPLPGVERVRVSLMLNGRPLLDDGQLCFGILSSSRQRMVRAMLPDTAELRHEIVAALIKRGPAKLGLPRLRAIKQYLRLLRSARSPHRHRHARLPHEDVRSLLCRSEPDGPAALAADARLAGIVAEERANAGLDEAQVGGNGAAADWAEPDYTQETYWEGLFAKVDPWGYRNDYESHKYEQTLDLIRDLPVRSALEIACAEGEFTRRLAGHAQHVLATDIAPTAVTRAAEACADLPNCSFARLDLLTQEPPASYDLIVASEVLYYLDAPALAAFVAKVARHLEPGGVFLTAHGNLLVDEPDRTGFGWPHHFGAKGIGEAVLAHGDFVLETELWTPLYRIMRFRKGQAAAPPQRIVADAARNLPERVAAQVRWRGGREAPVAERWHDFPILMYHRIAEDGPVALQRWRTTPAAFEAQLAHLRDEGWQGVSLERLRAALHDGQALPERSVMLTFDDATRDFMDVAVPLLHRYGFPATLFVPTGHVGGAASWDAAHGEPAPLLDWDELRMLRHYDVAIGAHGVTHRPLPPLDGEPLVRELAGSRFRLERELGRPVAAIAYPFGAFDDVVRNAARDTGYDFGFTCIDGRVSRDAHPLVLFRREVVNGIGLSRFADLLAGR